MTSYARVSGGEVVRFGLPQTGTLADGRTVSCYDRLDDRTLAAEGWLPIVEDKPSYDPERSTLTGPEYVAETSRVVARYLVGPKAPALASDVQSIAADGASVAVVTYTDYSASAPFSVTFMVNGVSASESLTDGLATIEVVTSYVGPIEVGCEGLSLTITAEEVAA